MTERDAVDAAADALGLRIVRRFTGSMFGAALVEGRGDERLIVKASRDLALAEEWAVGATMAARLRATGYPASEYVETGTTDLVTWSLQRQLPGRVPELFTVGHAEQLVTLACRHDMDSGRRQPWDQRARDVTRHALATLGSLPDRFDRLLADALDDTADLQLAHAAIVHGDFHHRNFMVDDRGRVTGVFDWDIAAPGEWRFDLISLHFACAMYPKTCEPAARSVVEAAVRAHCDSPTATFLMVCQIVRSLSMLRRDRPDWVGPASERMKRTLVDLGA